MIFFLAKFFINKKWKKKSYAISPRIWICLGKYMPIYLSVCWINSICWPIAALLDQEKKEVTYYEIGCALEWGR